MSTTARWGRIAASILLTASLVAAPGIAFADEATADDIQTDIAAQDVVGTGTQTDAAGALTPEAPKNGIPTVTVFVDESGQAIADANESDPDSSYGTFEELWNSQDHSVRSVGSVSIMVPDGYAGEYGSSDVPEGMLELDFIRGRGNSSWSGKDWSAPDKRAFKLKFQDKQDFFGMGASKEWALMANFFDDTMLNNRITAWLAGQMGMPYVPQMVPVDVVLVRVSDGQEVERRNLGSYCLSELVDVEDGRVAIDKLKQDMASDEDITGGYLLARHNSDQKDDVSGSNIYTLGSGRALYTTSSEFPADGLTEGQLKQRTYINDYLQRLEDLIMGEDRSGDVFIDEARHAQIDEMMDLRSTADYWWIQTLCKNMDAYQTPSTYLYKPRGGKLCWGPVWDFDVAWAYNLDKTGFDKKSLWICALTDNDARFVELLKERWLDPDDGLDAKLAELTCQGGVLDTYRDEIRASWDGNHGIYADSPNEYRWAQDIELDSLVEGLRTWIDDRRAWINGHLNEVGSTFHSVSYVVDGQEVGQEYVKGGDVHLHWPEVPARYGYKLAGWCVEGTDTVVKDPDVTKDTVFVAKYVRDDAEGRDALDQPTFLNSVEPLLATDGAVAYQASVVLPNVDGYDWSDARMTFTVQRRAAGLVTYEPRVVELSFDQAAKTDDGHGHTVATFTLPLLSLEMGQKITSTFSYTDGDEAATVEREETMGDQVDAFVQAGGDASRVAYAKALHDFGRTAYEFFYMYGNDDVTNGKYSSVEGCYTEQFDWEAAKTDLRDALRAIGSSKETAGSQIKKISMSLRFDSETTVDIIIEANKGVGSFTAHANYKGERIDGKKLSDTKYRIRVTGVRAQDLGELIEVYGNADGQYNMHCSAFTYAYAIMEKNAYGVRGNDLMSALLNYNKAAKAIAD